MQKNKALDDDIQTLLRTAIQHQHLGQLAKAELLYREVLRLKPDSSVAHNNLGIVLQQQGQVQEAIAAYVLALKLQPDYAEAHNNLGIAQQQQGQVEAAIEACRAALRYKPDYPEAYFNLGHLWQRQGQLQAAEHAYRQAIQLKPDYTQAYCCLGAVLRQAGQLQAARSSFEQALSYTPDCAEAHSGLGDLCHQSGALAAAFQAYQRALECDATLVQAHTGLGHLFYQQGQWTEAIAAYQRALQTNPNDARTHYNLGVTLKAAGCPSEAIKAYIRALKCYPDYFEAHNNLGSLLQDTNQFDLAIQAFQQALKCKPDYARGYANLATALKSQNRLEEAIAAYEQALALQPDLAQARFGRCMSQLPIIYTHVDEIPARRHAYQTQLEQLVQYYKAASLAEQAEAAQAIGLLQPFYLTYQGLDDRDLQQSYGQLIAHLMAARFPQWTQPLPPRRLSSGDKVRVGIVSGFFHNHSNWKIPIKGWVEHLDRTRFELFGYYTSEKRDQETAIARQLFDHFVQKPLSVAQWAELIRADQLDVLIFPEFGMDPMTIRLGSLRLAPVQATSWGHPETSGLPTIDYYLSSDLMEVDNAQDYYTESLVKLPNLSIYYAPLELVPESLSKSDIGLVDTDILYWCCQSLYKYLPNHDDIFVRIAEQLPNSRFVFIAHPHSEQVTEIFRQRLQTAFAQYGLDASIYCRFLPTMKVNRFAGVAAIADVFLDSIGWSGCNSSLESLAHNTPIVTYPGALMRSRHTAAMLKRMNITDLIAAGKDDYINLAVRLGQDYNYCTAIRSKIAENKHKLYGDLAPIQALERFLWNAGNGSDRPE